MNRREIMKKLNIYYPLIVFGCVTVGGLLIKYFEMTKFWDFYEALDTASAVALSLLAFSGYLEYIKSENVIKIYFQIDKQDEIDTGLSVLRKNCTRSEVFGILGMLQKDPKKRYEIKYTKDLSFLGKLQDIQKGDADKLIIPIIDEELEQFEYMESQTS